MNQQKLLFALTVLLLISGSFAAQKTQKSKKMFRRDKDLKINDLPAPDRPDPADRKFNSPIIESVIEEVKSQLSDPVLALMFEQNFPNTLDTTVFYFGKNETTGRPDAFIITGDIEAMWQRDSTNQVLPYLAFVNKEQKLKDLILGVINRQIHNVLLDPYANAYNMNATGSPWDVDNTTKLMPNGTRVKAMIPQLWERKFEIDSLAAVLKLQVEFFEQSNGDDSFMHEDYFKSLETIYDVLIQQQFGTREEDIIKRIPYTFQRNATNPTDTLSHGRVNLSTGKGGMVKSAFRPSDDACTFPYFIPGNAMLVTYLTRTAEIIANKNQDLSKRYSELSSQIKQGIYKNGITKDIHGNKVFAYETDGYGNHFKMDDANIPSLLSLPYLRFIEKNDPLYQNTRKMVLDPEQNPYYFEGKDGHGIGGPHVGDQYVWPMAIITRAITSDDDDEIKECLKILKSTTAGTYFMHESFLANNSENFTRDWFAWANTYFGELILDLLQRKPHLLTNTKSQV